jgi:hypothetical protein
VRTYSMALEMLVLLQTGGARPSMLRNIPHQELNTCWADGGCLLTLGKEKVFRFGHKWRGAGGSAIPTPYIDISLQLRDTLVTYSTVVRPYILAHLKPEHAAEVKMVKLPFFLNTTTGLGLGDNVKFANTAKIMASILRLFGQPPKEELTPSQKKKVTPAALRRAFATNSFVLWEKGEVCPDITSKETFLNTLADVMNTSVHELVDKYILHPRAGATSDDSLSLMTRSKARAGPPSSSPVVSLYSSDLEGSPQHGHSAHRGNRQLQSSSPHTPTTLSSSRSPTTPSPTASSSKEMRSPSPSTGQPGIVVDHFGPQWVSQLGSASPARPTPLTTPTSSPVPQIPPEVAKWLALYMPGFTSPPAAPALPPPSPTTPTHPQGHSPWSRSPQLHAQDVSPPRLQVGQGQLVQSLSPSPQSPFDPIESQWPTATPPTIPSHTPSTVYNGGTTPTQMGPPETRLPRPATTTPNHRRMFGRHMWATTGRAKKSFSQPLGRQDDPTMATSSSLDEALASPPESPPSGRYAGWDAQRGDYIDDYL